MVILGLLLVLVAIAVAAIIIIGTNNPDVAAQAVDIDLLNVTIRLTPLELLLTGMGVMFVFWLGLVIMREALARKARARREYALALLAEDEHRKSRGELVERERVDSASFTAARALRDLLLGVPPKIAGELVTLTDPWEIERRLTEAMRRALEDADRLLQLDAEIEQGGKEPN